MMKTEPRDKDIPSCFASLVLDAVSYPVIMIDGQDFIAYANVDAEQFFGASASILMKSRLMLFCLLTDRCLPLSVRQKTWCR